MSVAVTRGDFLPVATSEQGLSFVHTDKAKFYQLKLEQILSSSPVLAHAYLFNEIVHLQGLGSKGVKVHFNVHMSSPDTSEEIYQVLRQHVVIKDPAKSYLAEMDIDVESLLVEGKFYNFP